jgi:TonB family protein
MGVVFKARDPQIGRLVALKTITAGLADSEELLARFYREARAAGGLQHPNVVTVYEMGDAEGTPFIAMEYLEGESLEELITRRAKLSLAQRLSYIVQTCRALDYAHRRGIVHRDIKPGNIMVTIEGAVKVVDFGIARLVDASKTQTGTLLGTLGYMSPQQLRGKHADERSDIWSAGVVLYELLAYRRPFSGENHAALLLSIVQDEPKPIGELVPGCSAELAAVVHKALRKDESERYQSMEAFLLDLEPVASKLQRAAVVQMVEDSRQLVHSGKLPEARELLRQSLQLDTSNVDAKALLEQVNASLGAQAPLEQKQRVARPETLLDEEPFVEPAGAPGDAAREYVFEVASGPAIGSGKAAATVRSSSGGLQQQTKNQPTQILAERPAEKTVMAQPKASAAARMQPPRATLSGRVVVPGPETSPWGKLAIAVVLVGIITALGMGYREFYKKPAPAPVEVREAPAAAAPAAAAPAAAAPAAAAPAAAAPAAAPKPVSLEDQQRRLMELAHEAADRSDFKTARARLDDAEKLGGPLNSVIGDLRKRFAEEEHSSDIQQIAKRERTIWDQAISEMNQDQLDSAEGEFKKILALPEGGRRRADAQHYIKDVLPARREEDNLWAQAQQAWQSKAPQRGRQVVQLLDQIIAANGAHQKEAEEWRARLMEQFERSQAAKQGEASSADKAHFADLKKQFDLAAQKGDAAAEEILRKIRPQFRAIANAKGPLAPDALDYANNLIPSTIKQIDDRLQTTSPSQTPSDGDPFNDAVSQFKQAVADRDPKALRNRVLPEFRRLALAGGSNAAEASRYADVLIPEELSKLAPWPSIECPAIPAWLSPKIWPGAQVACGLTNPKLQWAQFSWPAFPSRARAAGVAKGSASLSISVDQEGNVVDVRPRSTDENGFTDSAVAAARQWKTNPPRAQGKPVRTQFSVYVPFQK